MEDGTFDFGGKVKFDGSKFSISLNNGTDLDDWKKEYDENKESISKDLEDINDAINNLGDNIGDAFKDGVISEVEYNNIKRAIITLDKEKEDVDTRYNAIYNDVSLFGSAKTNLRDCYNNFTTKHSNLKSIIDLIIEDRLVNSDEITRYENSLVLYNATIPELTKAFDTALSKIAEYKSTSQITDLEELLKDDIKNVSDNLIGLEDNMNNAFRDGIITEAEYISIKESLNRLHSENFKTKILCIYLKARLSYKLHKCNNRR